MTHDGLLRRVVGPREPGDLRALRTRRLRRKPDGDAGTPAYFFAEPCGGYQMIVRMIVRWSTGTRYPARGRMLKWLSWTARSLPARARGWGRAPWCGH